MELRVLVVCPDQSAADLLCRVLPELGIESEHTGSFSQAMQILEEQHFDGIILDYYPGENSQQLIAKLRVSSQNRSTVLIAIVDGEFSARPAFSFGASFVLYRPLSLERTRLSLRAARGLMRRERRRAPRIPVNATTHLDFPGATPKKATLLNLSDGGTALHSDQRVPSCKVYFQFELPGQEQVVRLSGEVAWQDASGRAGIRFVDVPQASRRAIHAWLTQNSFKARNDSGDPPIPKVPAANAAQRVSQPGEAGNRRGERRFACKLGADVYKLGSTIPNRCGLSDVSEGGCYVEMPTPFTAQTGVEIVIRTKNIKVKIRGQVQAVHPGFGMGVRFMFHDNVEREEILRLLATVAAGASLDELPL